MDSLSESVSSDILAVLPEQEILPIITRFPTFIITQSKHPGDGFHLQGIEVVESGLLRLIQGVSEPCPDRDFNDVTLQKYMYPFTHLMLYWDTLADIWR